MIPAGTSYPWAGECRSINRAAGPAPAPAPAPAAAPAAAPDRDPGHRWDVWPVKRNDQPKEPKKKVVRLFDCCFFVVRAWCVVPSCVVAPLCCPLQLVDGCADPVVRTGPQPS